MTRALLTAAMILAVSVRAGAQDEPPVLDDKNLKQWMEFVLPSAEDAAWERLGWRVELASAAAEAKALQRPILLWAMNGHPCGLT